MGTPDHLTCLLRNLYVSQEATARPGHGTVDCFKIQKGVHQAHIFSLCLFHLYVKYQARWITSWNQDCQEKYQQPQICRWYYPNGRKERRTKEPLDEGERGEGKSWLKNSTFKKRSSWHPVPSLHGKLKGKKWKQWQTLFSWAPESLWIVTVAMKLKDTCSLEEKLWQT